MCLRCPLTVEEQYVIPVLEAKEFHLTFIDTILVYTAPLNQAPRSSQILTSSSMGPGLRALSIMCFVSIQWIAMEAVAAQHNT